MARAQSSFTCARVADLAAGFVLGALEPAEMIAVREHLATCREPHPELSELGGVVGYLAQLVEPVEPPAALRSSIVSAVQNDVRADRRRDAAAERLVAAFGSGSRADEVAEPAAPVEQPVRQPIEQPVATPPSLRPTPVEMPGRSTSDQAAPTPIASARARRRGYLRWGVGLGAAAAVLALVMVGEAAYFGYGKSTATQPPNAIIEPGSRWVGLHSASGDMTAVVLLHPTGHLDVSVANAPATHGTQVYAVWAIGSNGGVVPLGSFKVDSGGRGGLTDVDGSAIDTATQIGIDLEPKAGTAQPTQPMLLQGALSH